MNRKCTRCGANIKAGESSCKKCGFLQVDNGSDLPENPKPATRRWLWWLLGGAAALILAIALLWNPLLLRFAPRVVLQNAVSNTLEGLTDRGQSHPLHLILSNLGKTDSHRLEGNIQYYSGEKQTDIQLTLETDQSLGAYSLGAAVNAEGKQHSFAFYADKEVLTGSYDGFQDGKHFGICYDTFREDLKNSAFKGIMNQQWFDRFEEEIMQLRDLSTLSADWNFSLEPYCDLVSGLLQNASVTSGKAEIPLGDELLGCSTITVQITQAQMYIFKQSLMYTLQQDKTLETLFQEAAGNNQDLSWESYISRMEACAMPGLHLVFYLHDGAVVYLDARPVGHSNWERVQLTFEAEATALTVDAQGTSLLIQTSAATEGQLYRHSLSIQSGDAYTWQLDTTWDTETGALGFSLDNNGQQTVLDLFHLAKTEDGFQAWFDCQPDSLFSDERLEAASCHVVLTYGGYVYIEKPHYLPPDQWDELVYNEFTYMLDQYLNGT